GGQMMKELTKAYITKYRLDSGIWVAYGEVTSTGIFVYKSADNVNSFSFLPCDYALTEQDALTNAENKRQKEIAKLEQQIESLKSLVIEINDKALNHA
ncbi:hypothetical protein, partial [Serratia fonticola]|uniref:hypothetical protein n=1 Tax=Serratia fonticola TaxID=47917 RepID=UPI0034C5C132